MPTDMRQIEDDNKWLRQQNERLQRLLQEAQTTAALALEKCQKAEQATAELRAIVTAVCDISNQERAARAEDTARRRSEGAKSGWEIRRARNA